MPYGQRRSSGQSAQRGLRAVQVRRPWRSRLTCSSYGLVGVVATTSQHLVVRLLERRLGPEQAEARADAVDVRVDRHLGAAEREQQHAGGRLAADAGQVAGGTSRASSSGASAELASGRRRRSRAGSAWMRAAFAFAMPPGRIASSISSTRRVAHRVPAREALAQARVGDVAVAVVGVLREHREDQLVDGRAMRMRATACRRPRAGGRGSRAGAACPRASNRSWRRRSGAAARYDALPVPVTERARATSPSVEIFWREAPSPGGRAVLYVHGVPEQLATTGSPSSSAPVGSRPTCRASAARASPRTSTTRSRATTRSSRRFLAHLGRRALLARRARLGRARRSRSPSDARSGSSAS